MSDFGTEQLRSQHFVKRSFHYQCLDLKYIAPKRIVTNKLKLIIYDIRLKNLHSFKDLISLDASILKELEATVTILSAVSQKVTQVQYPYIGVCYVTHSSQPNFRPIIDHYIISIRILEINKYNTLKIKKNKHKEKCKKATKRAYATQDCHV